jgi:hypothetical protein
VELKMASRCTPATPGVVVAPHKCGADGAALHAGSLGTDVVIGGMV